MHCNQQTKEVSARMKVTSFSMKRVSIPLEVPFKIALREVDHTDVVLLRLDTDEGVVGYGEAAPEPCVTGETLASVEGALELMAPQLVGLDPFAIERAHAVMDRAIAENPSAKCAVDLALYDLMGKKAGLPVWRLLGGDSPVVQSDITVSIKEPWEMARRAKANVERGFRIIKLKAGANPDDDERMIAAVREAVGEGVCLRVDANQGYTRAEASRMLSVYDRYGVDAVEQFLPAWDMEGSAELRSQARGVRVMLDESIHSPRDAARAARLGAADVLNIKLMKCGGLYPALKISDVAQASGLTCMVGCMLETPVAISAGLALSAARDNVLDTDCDSYRFYGDADFGVHQSFAEEGDLVRLSDEPGLGVAVSCL